MQSCPTADELPLLRKGLRKKKLPMVFDDECGSWDGVRTYAFGQASEGITVEWNLPESTQKKASFRALCKDATLELDRLELGWLIAGIIMEAAQEIMDSIGGPKEAVKAVSRHWAQASLWRHWAVVSNSRIPVLDAES